MRSQQMLDIRKDGESRNISNLKSNSLTLKNYWLEVWQVLEA